jgi:catechol 2,3-dioxygenase
MDTKLDRIIESDAAIHPATRMGHVSLTVGDLSRQVEFYQRIVGLQLHWRDGAEAGLGAGKEDLLRLVEVREAHRQRGVTGLYHFALLLPDLHELAVAIGRLFALHYPNYPTDHLMTKTTYLDDPEGNNIELYADTPEGGVFQFVNGKLVARHADGTPSNGREALDVEALFRNIKEGDRLDAPMPPETCIGHIHLYVADLDATMHFYHDLVGFDDQGIARDFHMGMVSAGGYHHHIGFNTWVGRGAPPPLPNSLGLRYFTVLLPDQVEMERVVERLRKAGVAIEKYEQGYFVSDPSQNCLLLAVQGGVDESRS